MIPAQEERQQIESEAPLRRSALGGSSHPPVHMKGQGRQAVQAVGAHAGFSFQKSLDGSYGREDAPARNPVGHPKAPRLLLIWTSPASFLCWTAALKPCLAQIARRVLGRRAGRMMRPGMKAARRPGAEECGEEETAQGRTRAGGSERRRTLEHRL